MVNGNSVKVQFGNETTSGTLATPDTQIEVTSESLSYNATKTEEGLLTGGIGGGKSETMSVAAEGNIATLAKPTSVGYFLKHVFGVETAEASGDKHKHTFTPVGNGESDFLPSTSFVIDRKAAVLGYSGMTANSIAFSASARDRLTIDVNYMGKTEVSGTAQTLTTTSKSEKAFKFHQAKVYSDSTELADVTNISFNYVNNLDNSKQTTSTGLYNKRPQPGTRECTAELTALFSTATETLRTSKFKTDATIAVKIEFTDEDSNVLTFTLPVAQISEMSNVTATGAETLSQTFTVKAVDNSTAFVKVELTNDVEDEY